MHNRLFPNNRNKDFDKLLEYYVFCIADTFIGQANPETQQQLIRLFLAIGNEPKPESPKVGDTV